MDLFHFFCGLRFLYEEAKYVLTPNQNFSGCGASGLGSVGKPAEEDCFFPSVRVARKGMHGVQGFLIVGLVSTSAQPQKVRR